MDNPTTYKKLVVFDFGIDWKDYSDLKKYKDLGLVYPLVKEASLYQTVVCSTSACLPDAIDFMKSKGINSGYLVASGGAIVYDMVKNEIISKICLTKEEVQQTVHHGLMLGLNMAITTPTEKFFFISNSVSYELIKQRTYSPYKVITTYEQLQEVINREDIVDIAFANLVSPHKALRENFNIYKLERFFDNEINDLNIKINQTSIFCHIAKKEATKLKALFKVMSVSGVTQLTDILYIAATCINRECFINFKNSLITSNKNFEHEIKDINKKRHYLANEINNLDSEFGLKSDSFWK